MSFISENIEKIALFNIELKNSLIHDYEKQLEEIDEDIKKYHKLIKKLTIEKEILEIELKKINKPIKYLSTSINFYGSQYNPNASLVTNIQFIIENNGYLMTSRNIADELLRYDSSLSKKPYDRLQKDVAANLSIYIKNKKYFNKYKAGKTDTLYGLQEWFYPNGQPMNIYYKENQLAVKAS